MSGIARPVHKPEYAEDKPEGDAHGHPGEKPHLFLMQGQIRLSSATVAFCHNALHYMSGTHPRHQVFSPYDSAGHCGTFAGPVEFQGPGNNVMMQPIPFQPSRQTEGSSSS
jgi:hypothetical protein